MLFQWQRAKWVRHGRGHLLSRRLLGDMSYSDILFQGVTRHEARG